MTPPAMPHSSDRKILIDYYEDILKESSDSETTDMDSEDEISDAELATDISF